MTAQLFQITVADEQGVVIDTGWVAMEVPLVPAGDAARLTGNASSHHLDPPAALPIAGAR